MSRSQSSISVSLSQPSVSVSKRKRRPRQEDVVIDDIESDDSATSLSEDSPKSKMDERKSVLSGVIAWLARYGG